MTTEGMGMARFEGYTPPSRGVVDKLRTAADKVRDAHRAIQAILERHGL
jgi:hypothetical protein